MAEYGNAVVLSNHVAGHVCVRLDNARTYTPLSQLFQSDEMRGFAPFRQRRSLICWAEKNCHGRTINFHTTTTNTGGNIIMIIVICFQEFIIASSLSSRIECQSWVSSRWGHNLDKEGHNLFPWKFRCDAQEQLQEHHRKEREQKRNLLIKLS